MFVLGVGLLLPVGLLLLWYFGVLWCFRVLGFDYCFGCCCAVDSSCFVVCVCVGFRLVGAFGWWLLW